MRYRAEAEGAEWMDRFRRMCSRLAESRRVPQAGSPASLLAGVEVREANLGLFASFWTIARHTSLLDLGGEIVVTRTVEGAVRAKRAPPSKMDQHHERVPFRSLGMFQILGKWAWRRGRDSLSQPEKDYFASSLHRFRVGVSFCSRTHYPWDSRTAGALLESTP